MLNVVNLQRKKQIKNMIKFNDSESSKERGNTNPLSLEDEYKVMDILNKRLSAGIQNEIQEDDLELLQRFVNHYQNMSHYVLYTGGLWCTEHRDKIIDKENVLFQLSFGKLSLTKNIRELLKGLTEACKIIHEDNKEKGFYDEPREFGTILMLITSKLSEALEADRNKKYANMDDFHRFMSKIDATSNDDSPENDDTWRESVFAAHFEQHIKDTREDKIADAIIRSFDTIGHLNIDIEKHIMYKLRYNKTRPQKHGKNY